MRAHPYVLLFFQGVHYNYLFETDLVDGNGMQSRMLRVFKKLIDHAIALQLKHHGAGNMCAAIQSHTRRYRYRVGF